MRANAAALVLAFAVAGCGGAKPSSTESGEALYLRQCGACHTLAAAGAQGSVGKSLDEVRPSYGDVLKAIAAGPGAMPDALVTGRDAREVAAYVARVAGR